MKTFELADGARAGITDRRSGVSRQPYDTLNLGHRVGDDHAAVVRNRERAAAGFGLDPQRVRWMHQVHGTDVAYAADAPDGGPPVADGVMTDVPGLALAVLVADCTPVLLADPAARVVGAAHAGRPGVVTGVVAALADAMAGLGARADRMVAFVGPAVCGPCYEVPADMQEAAADAVPQLRCTTRWGTPGLDIRAGVVAQLRAAGVAEIISDPRCTVESPELYSYRRDGRTGRFAGYVWLS